MYHAQNTYMCTYVRIVFLCHILECIFSLGFRVCSHASVQCIMTRIRTCVYIRLYFICNVLVYIPVEGLGFIHKQRYNVPCSNIHTFVYTYVFHV